MNTNVDPQQEAPPGWVWFLALGVGLILAGFTALSPGLVLAPVPPAGWLLLAVGAFEILAAARTKRLAGFWPRLLTAAFAIVAGGLVVLRAELSLTMVMAGFLLATGLLRIGAAVARRFPGWGWFTQGGVVSTLLGILLWAQWPLSGQWVTGVYVAIEIINRGWTWTMFAIEEKNHPTPHLPHPV